MGLLDSVRDALAPNYDAAAEYRCTNCRRAFAYSANIDDPSCPFCDADDLRELETP